jgi:hypothetical protein
VNVSSGDLSAATTGPAALTFTTAYWNTLQTVTVTGHDNTKNKGTTQAPGEAVFA